MTIRIINADVLDGLRQLPDESVHCVVTSPPYWGLRDYGVEGQIGLEATPQAFVARMVEVFREVKRVLRKDGTCWVNLGDSYAGSGRGMGDTKTENRRNPSSRDFHDAMVESGAIGRAWVKPPPGWKQKDLIGIPWRVAFALQDDGWWLRQDIIWAKPNPMPESVTDRCTKAHEYIFLLTKSARYYYDSEAIKETALWPDGPNAPDKISSPYGQGFTRAAIGKKGNAKTFRGGVYTKNAAFDNDAAMARDSIGNKPNDTMSRNKRSVWTIATAPFSEAHFATFPPELPETCIKAGSPKGGTVLDPFGGAGTTALVADRLQRNAILIELNPEYAAMAERRINGDRGGLLDLMEAAQ
jgi:DNA modification methylase